jgi:3'(2'), 5'-bisphosphate nucleotidase
MTFEKLLLGAIHAAVEAGKAVLVIYRADFSVEYKADDSPLTLADRNSHDIIKGVLAGFGLPLLSEEGKQIPYRIRKSWDSFWLVDPLDGTKEFIKRNGEFTVNIALIQNSGPVLGVVYVPVSDRLFYAARGIGAYAIDHAATIIGRVDQLDDENRALKMLMDKSVRLPAEAAQNSILTIVGSRSHGSAEFDRFIDHMRERYGQIKLASAGSSVKFCMTAEGVADIYPRFGPTMEWDTAAGQAIIENAGMCVLDIKSGLSLRYNKENLLNPWFLAGKNAVLSSFKRLESGFFLDISP